MITFCLTSCGRLDLLAKTISSFHRVANHLDLVNKFIISDDSANIFVHKRILMSYFDKYTFIFAPKKRGLSKSIDDLYSLVETPYIFHCEDDWEFYSNPEFLLQSLKILEAREDIHQVWLRDDSPHPVENEILTIDDVSCRQMKKGWMDSWSGFSWNPGLRRTEDYLRMFPKGYREFKDEIDCSKHAEKFDYKAVTLLHPACKHIGWDRHTPDFKL